MSNNDWYSEGRERLFKEASEDLKIPLEQILEVYSYFSELNLAGDYDAEKEIIWDMYYA